MDDLAELKDRVLKFQMMQLPGQMPMMHMVTLYLVTDLLKAATEREARIAELERLLSRYRTETPLGHQPHMIAHEVDEALRK